MRANLRRSTVVVSALLVIVGACGTSTGEQLQSPVAAQADPSTTTVTPTTTAAADEPAPASTTLPGEPNDDALSAGNVADVVGVAFDEVFVIRTLPGDDQPVAASLAPLTQLVLTGQGRELDQGTFSVPWVEVTAGGATGWISRWELVYLGAPRDLTAETVAAVGMVPTAPTMLELGKIVTDADADVPPPEIIVVAEPSAGPVSEVVYDVFPDEEFGDDTTRGSRLRVTGRQIPAGDLPVVAFASSLVYELVSVEATSLCTRGVDAPTGFCV